MLELKLKIEKPLNILSLGAHCDDIEIGAGGTLLKILNEYKVNEVYWVVFASNKVRKKEAENSAGCFIEKAVRKTVKVKDWRDGFLPYVAYEVKDYFESIKNEFVPDLIFTHYRDDRHQDHRLISDLTWNTWRNHFILEYEIPKYDGDLGVPNFYVELNELYIKRRNDIILDAYQSQKEKHWFNKDLFRSINRIRGMESACKYAEAFHARKIRF